MAAKKKTEDPLLANLRKLGRAYMHANQGDSPALAQGLRDLGAFNARQVKLLIDSARADALAELEGQVDEAVRGILRDRLASRVLTESDASFEEARWAVDTWAKAFGNAAEEPQESSPARPELTWDDDDTPAPHASDSVPAPSAASDALQKAPIPRYVPQPVSPRPAEQLTVGAFAEPAPQTGWGRWAIVAAITLLIAIAVVGAIALPNFIGSHRQTASPQSAAARPAR